MLTKKGTFSRRSRWSRNLGMLFLASTPSFAIPQGIHKDEELGFQIDVPKGWKFIPIANNEQWIVAKYLSNREYHAKKEWAAHTPDLKVIVFPNDISNGDGIEVKRTKEGVTIRIKNPYRDYKAYLEANSQGGFYIDKEESALINGIKATCFDVKFEKLTVPRRVFAWVFPGPDADWAVQFEVLEDYVDKLRPECIASLKSFKLFERSGSLRADGVRSGGSDIDIVEDWTKKLTPEERWKNREKRFQRELKTAQARLPEDWIQKKSKNYIALSHVDDRYTQTMLDLAEAIRTWLDKSFPWVGDGKPGPGLIRICKDRQEYSAFVDNSRDRWSSSLEITTYRDIDEGMRSFAVQYFTQRVVQVWFLDKNPNIGWGMPGWLDWGLDQYLMTAYPKNGRLEFRPDEWERDLLRECAQKGSIWKPRDIFSSTWEEFTKQENYWAQSGAFVRFLFEGQKPGKAKDILKEYMKNVVAVVEEEAERDRAERAKRGDNKPKTEEEEEAQYKERKMEEKKRLEEIFRRTFGAWTDDDWAKLEAYHRKFVD